MYITLEDGMKDDLREEDVIGPGSAGHDGAEKPAQVNRFRIYWHGFHYGYRVSIPNYEGGEVVRAEAYDALRELASLLITNAEMIPDPRREGATDCYAVTLDDLEALQAALIDGPTKEQEMK